MKRAQLIGHQGGYDRIILIVKELTAMAKKNDIGADSTLGAFPKTEVFRLEDIQIDITEHALVPKHSVLTDD